jgi:two-component system OmpR family sensor kinase/two-component system sensor histidine kinase BaeS
MHHGRDKPRWEHADARLFARFVLAFGLLVLLGCGLMALLLAGATMFLQNRPFPHPVPGTEGPPRWWLFLIVLVIVLVFVLRRLAKQTARRYTGPLSETMRAADALAEGDLSARVEVAGSGEFRHFTRSFNRMAEALETSDRQRRELLADVAHELRTPLTVVQGNLEGLRDGVYKATPEHLDLVLDETQKLGRLVDDLRLLTLAEAGQLPLDLQVLDVAQLLHDICDSFASQAHESEISLTVWDNQKLPPLVADPQRLGQVLGNLVTNALRHTPPGGQVTLGAELPRGEGPHAGVRLWVADTGEGIPQEDLQRIFDRFWRRDPARTHATGAGTGLGLAIAKSLIEAHKGRIWAESEVGQGTVVSCVLPLSTTEYGALASP